LKQASARACVLGIVFALAVAPTALPAPVLAAGAWDASVDTTTVPTVWSTNALTTFDLRLTNTGTNTWPAVPPDGTRVDVSVYFSGQNRDAVTDCLGDLGACRYALPADVPPGGSATIHVKKSTPFDHGDYTLIIDLVKENQFWFSAQSPNLPVGVAVQAVVPCEPYCGSVRATGPTDYWRLNDTIAGSGSTRDAVKLNDFYFRADVNSGVTGGQLAPPNDTDATAASIHVAPPFQPEPNNNSLNISGGAAVGPPSGTTITALGGWVKEDPDQLGHGGCFILGSPVNGNAWLCRDAASGTLSFVYAVVCNQHGHAFIAYGPAALDDGQWHYILGRYQDQPVAESELWIDGQLVGSAPKPATGECNGTEPANPIREIFVGQNFHGSLSEVAYWGGPLSASGAASLAAPASPPGKPTILTVVAGNGQAAVTWRPPVISGGSPITSYTVTSSPGGITRTVAGSTTTATVGGLLHDCQTHYTFTVTATNAVGVGPPSLPSDSVLTSGHPANPPSRVVIFVGGISSFMPQTVTYDPITDVPTYCGLKVNQAGINADLYTVASYFDGTHPAVYPDPSPNLTDAIAQQGAVILPFSYYGATFGAPGCAGLFAVNKYPPIAPGSLLPESAAAALNREVQSVKCHWPSASVVIVSHSNGGLVAETYWKDFLPSNPANVTAVFTLDGVINGVADPTPFLNPDAFGGLLYMAQLRPWVVNRYYQIWKNRGPRDAAILQANASGVFQPIGTKGDIVYEGPDCYAQSPQHLCFDGLDSQLLYVPPPGPGQIGTLTGTDFRTPQDAATLSDALQARDIFVSHGLVMEHFAVIARIATAVLNASSTPVTGVAMVRVQAGRTTVTTRAPAGKAAATSNDPSPMVPCSISNPATSVCALVLPDVVSPGQTILMVGTGLGATAGSVMFSSGTGQVNGTVTNWQSPVVGVEVALVVVPAAATTGPVSVLTSDGQLVHAGGVTVLGAPNQVSRLSLTATPSSPIKGQFASITVKAFNGGAAVPGATVVLSDGQGSHTAQTDATGVARFQYTGYSTANLVAVSGSTYTRALITFQDPPAVNMTLSVSAPTAAVGQSLTVSAVLTDASGASVRNQPVNFMAFGAAPAALSGQQAITNSSGVASITVSSPTAGTTSVIASANYDFAAQAVDATWLP
jgi:hypothetical protein